MTSFHKDTKLKSFGPEELESHYYQKTLIGNIFGEENVIALHNPTDLDAIKPKLEEFFNFREFDTIVTSYATHGRSFRDDTRRDIELQLFKERFWLSEMHALIQKYALGVKTLLDFIDACFDAMPNSSLSTSRPPSALHLPSVVTRGYFLSSKLGTGTSGNYYVGFFRVLFDVWELVHLRDGRSDLLSCYSAAVPLYLEFLSKLSNEEKDSLPPPATYNFALDQDIDFTVFFEKQK